MTTPDSGNDAQTTPPVWFNAWTNGTFTTVANAVNDQRSRIENIEEWKNRAEALLTRQSLGTPAPALTTTQPQAPQPQAAPPQPLVPGLPDQATSSSGQARKSLSPRWIGLLVGAAIGIVVDIVVSAAVPDTFTERIPSALITVLYFLIFGICSVTGYMVGESKDPRTT